MRIYLRPIKLEDGSSIVKWRNSDKVRGHCFSKVPVTVESNGLFYSSFIETGKYKQFIVERIDEDFGVSSYPIATVYLKDMDHENNRCELCIFTSDDEEWNTESQSIAIKILIEKAFEEFGMHKVYTYVFANNVDEIELMKNSGLEIEAELKEEVRNMDNQYESVYRMVIFKKFIIE